MNQLGREYQEWILAREIDGCMTTAVDDEHIAITKECLTGAVNFYCFDGMPIVVELHVTEEGSDEPLFFLHFELEDLVRAQELFEEMAEVLASAGVARTTHVLLCCTVGMTTTMFAGRLNDAAKTLSLDYVFEAKALEDAKREGGSYDAVMLAPQVGFRRREVAEAFPDAVVFEIPARVFASYDAAGALRTLMGLLGDESLSTPDSSDLRVVREIKSDKVILLIEVINHPKSSTIAWRVYDRYQCLACDEVHKRTVDFRDLEDILATLHLHDVDVNKIDAVGIALPGPVDFGQVVYENRTMSGINVEKAIADKFGLTVFVDNNANAATVGCYVSQADYDSVVLHTQQVGYLVGGQGTVVNGHLVRGRRGMAGELGPFNARLIINGGLHLPEFHDNAIDAARVRDCGDNTLVTTDKSHVIDDIERLIRQDIPWRADRMLPVLATMLLANIAVVAPDAIYINYDLIDDMDALRAELAKELPEEYIPDLIHINDYYEKIFAGEMALVLQRLNISAA